MAIAAKNETDRGKLITVSGQWRVIVVEDGDEIRWKEYSEPVTLTMFESNWDAVMTRSARAGIREFFKTFGHTRRTYGNVRHQSFDLEANLTRVDGHVFTVEAGWLQI